MRCRIVKRPQARIDIIDLMEHIAKDDLAASLRFLDGVEASLEHLSSFPQTGESIELEHPLLQGLRAWSVHGFPNYLIFFRPKPSRVEVVRVGHGSHNWQAILGRVDAP